MPCIAIEFLHLFNYQNGQEGGFLLMQALKHDDFSIFSITKTGSRRFNTTSGFETSTIHQFLKNSIMQSAGDFCHMLTALSLHSVSNAADFNSS